MADQPRGLGPRADRLRGWQTLPGLSLFALMLGALLLILQPLAGAQGRDQVDVVRVDGAITPPMARYVEGAIERASEDGAAAVVLAMDTPGGLATAMDDIIADILGSPVPVVVYVGPEGARAASAGVFIAYASHVAAMAPGTRIGSASPVTLGGGGGGGGDPAGGGGDGETIPSGNDETMARKVTNDAVSQIKNLAQRRGRNAEWAERAVREAVNVTADEAVQLGVVDLMAPSVPALLDEIDGRTVRLGDGRDVVLATAGAELREVEMGWVDQLLQLLADPTVAYILLSLGSLGLVLELSNPGAIVPGVVGGLALLLALFGLGTLPVNWAGVLLIGFAFLLFAVDLFVPSFGALTVGGVISFVLGSYLLIGGDAPPGFAIARPVIWTMTALLVGFFLLIAGAVVRARRRPAATGREGLLGEVGTVRQALAPEGMVFVDGELWHARASEPGVELPAGAAVAVAAVEGLRLVVRPVAAPATIVPAGGGEAVRSVGPVAGTRRTGTA